MSSPNPPGQEQRLLIIGGLWLLGVIGIFCWAVLTPQPVPALSGSTATPGELIGRTASAPSKQATPAKGTAPR